jgi:arylsulfatase A-like enzyme
MRSAHPKTIVLGGLLGGLGVGICDGLQAGFRAEIPVPALLANLLLVGTVDLLVGWLLALGVVLVAALARWGRRGAYPRLARRIALGLVGVITAAVTGKAFLLTGLRADRFLAAVTVTFVALGAGTVGALVAPAFARVLGPLCHRRSANAAAAFVDEPRSTPEGMLVLAPAAALVVGALVFLVVRATVAPLRPLTRLGGIVACGALAGLLPLVIASTVGQARRLPRGAVGVVPFVLAFCLGWLFVRRNWTDHLQFLPWQDLRALVLVALMGGVVVVILRARSPRGLRLWAALSLAPPAAALLALGAGSSEAARKASALHGGLVAPVIASVRPLLDRDGDRFPGLLGGGDCNDRDPGINPAAQDLPQDGIDQDCDGHDLSLETLVQPPPAAVPETVPTDMNVLLVIVDSLRADHLGCYGYRRPTSPRLDQLAAQSVLFANAWAHAPVLGLSVPSLLTGRPPETIDWEEGGPGQRFSRAQRTLGEILHERGFITGAFYAHDHFDRAAGRGFERGIEHYDSWRARLHPRAGGGDEFSGSSARQIADDALDFLKSYGSEQWRFFLTLHFFEPHARHERPPGAPNFGAGPADLYDSEIWFVDQQLGRIIDRLDERGLSRKTIVVITGDHGASFGAHPGGAGPRLFSDETAVPLIVRVPGLPPRWVKAPAGLADVAPTVMNLLREARPRSFRGRSLVEVMAGQREVSRPVDEVVQELDVPAPDLLRPRTLSYGLASATHHLVWERLPQERALCFDTAADPAERRDLSATRQGERLCAGMMLALRRHLALASFARLDPDAVAQLATSVTAPGAPAPAPEFPQTASFGEVVRLLGHDVAPAVLGPEGLRLRRGGVLQVTTHFEAAKPIKGWRLFFYLEGPLGSWRNLDHPPVGGAFPLERWLPGQRIRDRISITADERMPSGVHTLYAGFWGTGPSPEGVPVSPESAQAGTPSRVAVLSFTVE